MLPWPNEFLVAATWTRTKGLLDRLIRAARRGALPGTLMLVGHGGLGREAVALELAAALVCRQAGAGPCSCAACERVRRGVHPDVSIVDVLPGKSDITIAQAREIATSVTQLPYEGARRVFILGSVETPPLNTEAASSLLKTLEEPPSHVTLLLLATNPARVLPTIVSRSVVLRVPWPDDEELRALVAAVGGHTTIEAGELLATGMDASLLVRASDAGLGELHRSVGELTRQILAGDALALLRLAAMSRQAPACVSLALAAAVDLAVEGGPETAERALRVAASLIHAGRRHSTLHVDLDGALVAALSPSVAGGQRGS